MNGLPFLEKKIDNVLPEWREIVPLPKIQLLEIIFNENYVSIINVNRKKMLIETSKSVYEQFKQEFDTMSTWICVLNSFTDHETLLDIVYGILYTEISSFESKKNWLEIWKKSKEFLLNNKNTFPNSFLVEWFERISKPTELEKLFEIIRITIRLNLKLNMELITQHLSTNTPELIYNLTKKSLLTIFFILCLQTDNTYQLFEKIKTTPYSIMFPNYNALNRQVNQVLEKEYVQSFYDLNFPVLNMRCWHIIVFDSKKNPELTSYPENFVILLECKGFGSGFSIYHHYLMPNTERVNEYQRLRKLKYNEKKIDSLILYSDSEPLYYFSLDFYSNENLKQFFDPLKLYELAQEVIHTHDYYHDININNQAEISFKRLSSDNLEDDLYEQAVIYNDLSKDDLNILNIILEENIEVSADIARKLHLDNNLVSICLTGLKAKKVFKKVFLPVSNIFPETTILYIKTSLSIYEKFKLFLKRLPYVRIQDAYEVNSNELWYIITIYTPYGTSNTILQTIMQNFTIDALKFLRVNSVKKNSWQLKDYYSIKDDS